MKQYDLLIIGGGPAGMAAAVAASDLGAEVLIVERAQFLGGILNQCIHNGFGLHYFNEELTGPEYAERFKQMVRRPNISVSLNSMVLELHKDRSVRILNESGINDILAKSVVIATGCRERARGALNIPGTRPAGVFTAGTAQYFINMEGLMPCKKAVILGSGDIGLIMARRLMLEGAQVPACVELMPYSTGLKRNVVQCLDDFGIPLYYSHTVTHISGKDRVESVTVSAVDSNLKPIKGSEMEFECDALLLSVGLIPENELARDCGILMDPITRGAVVDSSLQCSIPGIFACGNALHVHDLVDYVTEESYRAGKNAALYAAGKTPKLQCTLELSPSAGISYVVPQKVLLTDKTENVELFFRVNRIFKNVKIKAHDSQQQIASFRREYVAPGEMERVVIPYKLLERVKGDQLKLFVEEE